MNVKAGGTTMNYWKQFAEMLGLELEQDFYLADVDGNRKDEFTYKITENGLLYKSPNFNDWLTVSLVTFRKIMNGDYKVVSKPWKPEKGEEHWYYSDLREEATCITWYGSFLNLLLWNAGNCFKTKEEAETKGKEIMEQIQKEYEEK